MATFYIDSSEGILELTSTTDIRVSEPSTVTKHKLESGAEISDHVINNNVTATFNGVISDIRSITYNSEESLGVASTSFAFPVRDYVNALRRVRDKRELFSVRYDGKLPILPNCVITRLELSKDVNTSSGFKVTLAFEQVRISERASITTVRSTQLNPDLTQDKTESGGENTVDGKLEAVGTLKFLSPDLSGVQQIEEVE